MSSPTKPTPAPSAGPSGPSSGPLGNGPRFSPGGDDRNDKLALSQGHLPMPGLSGPANGPVGNLLKGAVDKDGELKDASLTIGIKLDLEAEVHLTARVRGDILVGLY